VIFESSSSRKTIDNSNRMVATRRGLGSLKGTTNEATQNPMIHDVPKETGVTSEILKLPSTLRPKEDKQVAGLVFMSLRNL